MLIFTGPAASGKTTYMRVLCRKLRIHGKKCIRLVSTPFGGPAFLLVVFLTKLLIFSHRPRVIWPKWRGLRVLEKFNPKLLSKLLTLLVTLDFLFKTLQHLVLEALEKLGFTVLVEDYLPQMISDHLFFKLYSNSKSKMLEHIIVLEVRFFYRYAMKSGNTTCIHVYADSLTRIRREARRSGAPYISNFYDKVARSIAPRNVCKALGIKTVFITNEEKVLVSSEC